MKNQKRYKAMAVFLAVCLMLALLCGCAGSEPADARDAQVQETQAPAAQTPSPEPLPEATVAAAGSVRSVELVSFDGLSFTPWDTEAAVAAAGENAQTKYTILLYLNGADLETEAGMATSDLQEILESKFDTKSINILLLTGGTAQWQNDIIPNDTCMLYQVVEDGLKPIADIGLCNMGDAGTLCSFIDFGMQAYPAEKYGLILWDHGGGSIAGYGVDELFDYDSMRLIEFNYALEKSKAAQTKFEFIGFDACLMATIETAAIAQDYANYLIASEDLEPGYGWNYNFLSVLSQNPNMSGAEIGTVIVDLFTAFYEGSGEDTTLSVIDLSKANGVLLAMGDLMAACNSDFSKANFNQFAKSRNNTKTFGGGSPRDNESDMIDIADMAQQLEELYPAEAKALFAAVDEAVLYNKNSEQVEGANGLTTYYTFGGKAQADDSIEVYSALVMEPQYTKYVTNFASMLTGESFAGITKAAQQPQENSEGDYTISLTPEEIENLLEIYFTVWEPVEGEADYYFMIGQNSSVEIDVDGSIKTQFDGEWPGINGEFVCLYEIGNAQGSKKYAIPAVLNGEEVDLIAVFDASNPEGRILGARPVGEDNTDMAAKSLTKIKAGDTLQFLYYAEYFGEDASKETEQWYEGEEFKVSELKFETLGVNAGETYLYGFLLKDIQQNEYYTDFVEVEFTD